MDGGAVVLDIGNDVGALVVRAEPGRLGEEIEIRRVDGSWSGEHAAVRRHTVAGASIFAGVFPALGTGRYEIRWRPHPSRPLSSTARAVGHRPSGGVVVSVAGATVAESALL